MRKIIFFSILTLATVQCSNGSDGGGGIPGANLPELTTEQKNTMRSFNGSIDTISAVKTSKMGNNSNMDQMPFSPLAFANSPTADFDKPQQDLIDKLTWAETNHYCNSSVSLPSGSMDITNIPNASIAIVGTDCPMNYQMTMSSALLGQTANSVSIQMAITEKFVLNEVMDEKPELHLGLDVTKYTTQFKFNLSASGSQNSITMNMNGTGTMTAKSLSIGDVTTGFAAQATMRMHASNNSMNISVNMNMTITQKYADFEAVGYITGSVNTVDAFDESELANNGKFYINGKVVTESEFEEVFGNSMASLPLN